MIVVFAMAATIWIIGWAMKAPVQARLIMLGLLFVSVLAIQIALPAGHPLREGTGGSPALWLLFGAFVLIAWLYARGLFWLRARTNPVSASPPPPPPDAPFGEVELERYARHLTLREIGGPGQRALKDARVLVVGAGGLGSPALAYLGAAGVGCIGVIDSDVVELTNLQRQVIHRDADIGVPKVFSAERAIRDQNPFVTVRPYNRRLTEDIAADLFDDYDLILDGSDNFDTRYLVNRTAVARSKPLISAALSQWEGQIGLFDPAGGGPCYACLFPQPPAEGLAPSCAEAGVLGPLPGVVGAMMAVEAVKALTGAGATLAGRLLIYDALWGETRVIAAAPRPGCAVCGGGASARAAT